jgi:serine/threonine protein kinase
MSEIHRNGIVHCDINLKNILVKFEEGTNKDNFRERLSKVTLKIADFGSS